MALSRRPYESTQRRSSYLGRLSECGAVCMSYSNTFNHGIQSFLLNQRSDTSTTRWQPPSISGQAHYGRRTHQRWSNVKWCVPNPYTFSTIFHGRMWCHRSHERNPKGNRYLSGRRRLSNKVTISFTRARYWSPDYSEVPVDELVWGQNSRDLASTKTVLRGGTSRRRTNFQDQSGGLYNERVMASPWLF